MFDNYQARDGTGDGMAVRVMSKGDRLYSVEMLPEVTKESSGSKARLALDAPVV